MNLQRLNGFPDILKLVQFLLVIGIMLFTGVSDLPTAAHPSGRGFFWFASIFQLVFLLIVITLFLYEKEKLLTLGRVSWYTFEIGYSVVFGIFDLVLAIITMTWLNYAFDGTLGISAILCFALLLIYILASVMAYRIETGRNPTTMGQDPTGNVEPGNIGSMHPGI
uniref:MARVEL domain-containing protein n=1 Tax=Parastrongyloides trichosuri TaxID=131310 RepID=A0A0N4ZB49_PARTI